MARLPGQAAAVEAALASGEVGSLLFVTDPAEMNRLQRLAVEGSRHGIPGAVRVRRDPRPAHDLPGADRDGGVVGSRGDRGRARRSPRARPGRSGSTGRSRRWSTSRGIRAGAGSSRAPARTRISASAVAAAQVRGFQGDGLGCAGPGHRRARSTSPATAPRWAGATTTRSTCPTPSCGTSTCPRSRRRSEAGAGEHHDRLHGSQRHTGHREPLAADRRAARRRGVSTASSSATPRRCTTCAPTPSRPT